MSNKLFLVCPFSNMENFIREKYGDDVFFITAMAAIFQFQEKKYLQAIRDFIIRENITEIYIVSDTLCRFINSAIKKEIAHAGYSEGIIQKLFADNYAVVMDNKSLEKQQIKLAELIVQHQAEELRRPDLFQQQIIQNNISIRGIITTKSENGIIQLNPS